MFINPEIIPLFKDLSAQGFDQYLQSTDFERLCIKFDLSDFWQQAVMEEQRQNSDSLEGTFMGIDYNEVLARFLDHLRSKRYKNFLPTISEIIVGFLSWTRWYPSIEEIIADLEALGIEAKNKQVIEHAWAKIDANLMRKAQLLKDTAVARATGKWADEDIYFRLRHSLTQNPITAPHMPAIITRSRTLDDFWTAIKTARDGYQPRREFLNDAFNSLLNKLDGASAPVESFVSINEAYIHEIWQKALQRRSTDPEAAITSARTLLETVCRYILEAKGIEADDSMDLPKLYKTTVTQLNMSPEQHTQPVFKQILSGCHSVVEGLGSLRNKYSDAHGKGPKAIKPSERHAALAVNLAGAMCSFMLGTLQAEQNKKV